MGDKVRISETRVVFKKGYLPNWTTEIFTVSQVLSTKPTTYRIKDEHDEELMGSFYNQELQKVGAKDVYEIERVLKRSKNRLYVKWLGYPTSFNSWIFKSALCKKK